MILLRLLTTGKSLVGLHESRNRYRVMDRGLPTFVAKQNPFRDEPRETDPGPAADGAAPQGAPGEARPWYRSLAGKFGLHHGTVASAPARTTPAFSVGTPTQCELSLDQVKVVRNDLSDSDFEVVARRRNKTGPKPEPSTEGPDSTWGRVSLRIFGAGKAR